MEGTQLGDPYSLKIHIMQALSRCIFRYDPCQRAIETEAEN